MKDRVRQVQDYYHLNNKQFANQLCIAEATVSSIYRGRTAPTNNLIQAIHQVYPGININWLMFGEGEMLLPLSAGLPSEGTPASSAAETAQNVSVGQNVGLFDQPELSLFSQNQPSQAPAQPAKSTNNYAPQSELQMAELLSELKKANEIDRNPRRIKEIRVFYSDGTYESFAPTSR